MHKFLSVLAIWLFAGCSATVEGDRVIALETRATALEGQLSAALAKNDALENRLAVLESAPAPAAATALAAVEASVAKLDQSAGEAAEDRGNLTVRVGALENESTVYMQQIGELEGTVQGLASTQSNTEDDVSALGEAMVALDPAGVDCPEGMFEPVGAGYCIDGAPRTGNENTAPIHCGTEGAHVCTGFEWLYACSTEQFAPPEGIPEFVADFVDGEGHAKLVQRHSVAGCTGDQTGATTTGSAQFRCCVTKASLVYGPAITNE